MQSDKGYSQKFYSKYNILGETQKGFPLRLKIRYHLSIAASQTTLKLGHNFVDQEFRLICLAGLSVIHGVSVGMDGWIYFLAGFFAHLPGIFVLLDLFIHWCLFRASQHGGLRIVTLLT